MSRPPGSLYHELTVRTKLINVKQTQTGLTSKKLSDATNAWQPQTGAIYNMAVVGWLLIVNSFLDSLSS